MNFIRLLTSAPGALPQETYKFFFEPMNFVEMLKYMGLGMLIIFVVIGIIILCTMMINKFFAE